jgi:hypothetical protein
MRILRPILTGFLVTTLLGLMGVTARAQDPGAASPVAHASRAAAGLFGDQGQWAFSISSDNEFPFSFSKTGGGDWGLTFRPSADYFIAPNVSVGGIVSLSSGGGNSSIGFGPRVGYDLIVSSLISIWFRGGVFFNDFPTPMNGRDTTTDIGIQAPFSFTWCRTSSWASAPSSAFGFSKARAAPRRTPWVSRRSWVATFRPL